MFGDRLGNVHIPIGTRAPMIRAMGSLFYRDPRFKGVVCLSPVGDDRIAMAELDDEGRAIRSTVRDATPAEINLIKSGRVKGGQRPAREDVIKRSPRRGEG